MKSARGTVRAGCDTSPLGTSATSTPTKAKINRIAVRPTAAAGGRTLTARCSGRTNQTPMTISTPSGTSFATVTASTRRAPGVTPRTFTAASPPNSIATMATRVAGWLAEGQIPASESDEDVGHARHGHRRAEGIEHAGQKTDERPECRFHVGIEAAGERDAAAGRREARHDERHHPAADDIGEGRRRPEVSRDGGGQHEDAGADRGVDGACDQPPHADFAQESRVIPHGEDSNPAPVWRVRCGA